MTQTTTPPMTHIVAIQSEKPISSTTLEVVLVRLIRGLLSYQFKITQQAPCVGQRLIVEVSPERIAEVAQMERWETPHYAQLKQDVALHGPYSFTIINQVLSFVDSGNPKQGLRYDVLLQREEGLHVKVES